MPTYDDLRALFINCTLKRSPEQSHTQGLADIDMLVDIDKMEHVLMEEGIKKFADPMHALLALLAEKRAALMTNVK